jgi:hypothetical protein
VEFAVGAVTAREASRVRSGSMMAVSGAAKPLKISVKWE